MYVGMSSTLCGLFRMELFKDLLNDSHVTYINAQVLELALSVVETGRPVNFFNHGEYGQWQFFVVYLYINIPGEKNFWKYSTAIHAPSTPFFAGGSEKNQSVRSKFLDLF